MPRGARWTGIVLGWLAAVLGVIVGVILAVVGAPFALGVALPPVIYGSGVGALLAGLIPFLVNLLGATLAGSSGNLPDRSPGTHRH